MHIAKYIHIDAYFLHLGSKGKLKIGGSKKNQQQMINL